MKLKLQAENPLEWIALQLNLAPTPLIQTQMYFTIARAIMAAAELGVYEVLGENERTADEVAAACHTHPGATRHLLDALVGIGYVDWKNGRYTLNKPFRKWLLQGNDANLVGKLRFQFLEWDIVGKMEEFVRTGQALDLHQSMDDPAHWKLYQEGMRDLSINAAKEVADKVPFPFRTGQMLDIGGSHGLYSIELCKKHPGLRSTVLDLPGAIESASAIAQRYDTTGRVTYQPGNALTDELGTEQYELVLINNVVHHFTVAQNLALAQKIAKALKPGGHYVIGEFIRLHQPGAGGVMPATTNLYFAMTSASGCWSREEMHDWQRQAGLQPQRSIKTMAIPGWELTVAKKG